jgi:hypothetical protein
MMSFKTNRLTALFPDAYAAREGASLLYRVLDSVGLEFMRAGEAVKSLLKSHWVNYAQGDALDGLAATFGVARRKRPDGVPEPDEAFRRRLKAVVPYFTGGGTLKAVSGAVRSALGLPFDLELFRKEIAGPGGDPTGRFDALIKALGDLVRIEEFSPKPETMVSTPVIKTATASEVIVEVGFSSVKPVYPRIEWTFTKGGGRFLKLARLDSGAGVMSRSGLRINPGETLVLTADAAGALKASIGLSDVSAQFTALDSASAPQLPVLPGENTQWKFTSQAGVFGYSTFNDSEGFDTPEFTVRFTWMRFQPLTFDVIVPYFIDQAVRAIQQQTGYRGGLFTFEGLPLEIIQSVVDQTRAAGVKGSVHFSLNFAEDHGAAETFSGTVENKAGESHDMTDSLVLGDVEILDEDQSAREQFALGGVFDVSVFDGVFAFQ